METLQYYGIMFNNVSAVATDSAAYMTLCIKLLRELVNPDLIHVQCWVHKLDKVAKVFSDKLTRLNQCVSNTKKLFKNTRKRKHRYIKFLSDKYSFSNA
ncbi:ATP-dependent helicase ULS1 [Frankliniella fusca]|uniref:ATP-dependent helicase ULS1 n=1 Tax=Frankliniella fusca TaxID=407009 RepID=A0AAE1HZB5_9NEOP|nr:ATP-dependent helicase ULS1 [Frankliniella fusca]